MAENLHGIGFKVFDPDDRGGSATLVIAVSEGTLTVAAGNSGVGVSGSGTSSVTVTGTFTQINNLLTGNSTGTISYATSNAGTKTLTLTCTDQDGLITVSTKTMTASAFAAPVVGYSGGTVTINTGATTDLAGQGFTVTDSDDAGELATMTIQATDGELEITVGDSGVAIVSGNESTLVTLAGTIDNLNSLLDGTSSGEIDFTSDDAGSETITVTVTDVNGESDNAQCTVSSGSPPVVTAPTLIAAVEDAGENLHGIGFSVSDADDGGGTATCVISTTEGTIDVTVGDSGVTITGGDTTDEVTFTGTITQIKNLLDDTSTGTIVLTAPDVAVGTVTVEVTDSTSRVGSASCTLNVETSTATWQGYASFTPRAAKATIADFTAPIDLSFMPQAWWDLVTDDGRDIRVTDSSNNLLPRDLVDFDKEEETGLLMVKFSHSTTPPTLRIWVGTALASAPAAGDTYGQHATYHSRIRGFYPFGGGDDRTSYVNHLTMATAGGGVSAPVTGTVSGPTTSVPATSYTTYQFAHSAVSMLAALPVAMFGCFKMAGLGGVPMNFMSTGSDNDQVYYQLAISGSQGKVTAVTSDNNASFGIATSVGGIGTGQWNVVGTEHFSSSDRNAFIGTGVAENQLFTGNNTAAVTVAFTSPRFLINGFRTGSASTALTAYGHFHASHVFFLQNQASGLVGPMIANYALAMSPSTYMQNLTFTSTTITGL